MKLYRTLAAVAAQRALDGCVVSLAAYDGLHIGHQAMLRHLKAESLRLGRPSVVFSYEPSPGEYFAAENPPARLTRFREKFRVLEAFEIDEFFCPRFDPAVRQLTPDRFIAALLVEGLDARHVVVGEHFKFPGGEGTVEDVRAAGRRHGFSVSEVPAVYHNDELVSSSAIRRALAVGDLAKARAMLGRPYMMSGRVVHGPQLGRTLGFPTANVPVKRAQSAVMGIFAVRVGGLGERLLDGVANVGTRPTVDSAGKTLLEVFIFDFDRDIYGCCIDVHFVSRLRDELKFPDLSSMQTQMHKDVEQARAVLAADR